MVMQVERPQEAHWFARQDVGHKQSLLAHSDGREAPPDGKTPHQFHHLHLQVPLLRADLSGESAGREHTG